MTHKQLAFLLSLSILSWAGCADQSKKTLLFELVPVSTSNIDFVNRLRESPQQNVLTYEYFYNGAGVAVADFNGDQWPDIYLVSNLEANALYINEQGFRFENTSTISQASGKRGFSTGVSIVDINADGRLDIYICKSGRFDNPDRRRNELLVNMGNNAEGIPLFEEQAKKYGLDIPAYSTQAAFFDYDRDGDLDMFLINHGIDTYDTKDIAQLQKASSPLMGERLFKNENKVFVDVTDSAGIINNKLGFGLGVGIGDLNNDHYPDIYVSNDYSGKDHLYINQKDGTFQEQIRELTNQISFYSMGNDIGDINNDGWQDIINLDMVAAENYGIKTSMSAMNPAQFQALVDAGEHHQYMFNSLLLNNGTTQEGELPFFSNIGQLAGISNTDWSWAPLLFDMDNNGWQDLFVTNGIKRNIRNNDAMKVVNQLNQQVPLASNPNARARLMKQMLDQFPYHQKPNYFFLNYGVLRFYDITQSLYLDSLYSVSSGAAYADLDLDGDLDLIINNADQAAFLLKNNAEKVTPNQALRIQLKGPANNPFGIGAKVSIESDGLAKTKEVYTSRGYKSSVPPVLHFGLGQNPRIEKLSIVWGDGKVEEQRDIQATAITLDYQKATLPQKKQQKKKRLCSKIEDPVLTFAHRENEFDDFARESLLPHKLSNMGPAVALGDVNDDGQLALFIGGAKGQEARLFTKQGEAWRLAGNQDLWASEKAYEDVAACFFDADADSDLDLIVGSGSNEWEQNHPSYQLRLYENKGEGIFSKRTDGFPDIRLSTGVIVAADFDGDGDEDLFVGGRQSPGNYPHPCNSFILKNNSEGGKLQLEDATAEVAPFLKDYGMVTDAIWEDINGDEQMDLITVGEWMSPKILINSDLKLIDQSAAFKLGEEKGWWYSIAAADFDGDGDRDLIAGNLGLNYKYKASKEQAFEIFAKDFDQNGTQDIVLSYYEEDQLVPLRGRECSSNQMPFIKEKFKSYTAFGKATMKDVFGASALASATHFEANNFVHYYFENKENQFFEKRPLAIETQISSINAFAIEDFNADGYLDVICAGNLYGSEVETPRNDASFGQVLLGDGQGNFEVLPYAKSGFRTKGEVRDLVMINNKQDQEKQILLIKNNDHTELFKINKN
ncbi:MAG: VCBS repeat-containing protein [Bacteroidota bacterium]